MFFALTVRKSRISFTFVTKPNYPCWPKGTLSDFVLMITNHMTLFSTNQVCVFLSISDSKNIVGVFFLERNVL